jgi:hypothetical protein
MEKGPGYFKLNNSILTDKEYQTVVKNTIKMFAKLIKTATLTHYGK